MKKMVVGSWLAAALCVAGGVAWAEETAKEQLGTKDDPITTTEMLLRRIGEYNTTYNGKTSAATLYVAPGEYDVSSSTMTGWDSVGGGHLTVRGYVLSGTTTNPRDVVIYGNRSNRLFVLWNAGLEYLTVSNACWNGNSGGGVAARETCVSRHVILTDCQADSSGGGSNGGKWYDCVYMNNKASNGSGGGGCGGYYENCVFTNNTATSMGGAVYYGGKLINCTVVGNKAKTGGGISGNNNSSSIVTMRGGELAYNEATGNGGGSSTSTLSEGVKVHHNTAKGYGGGAYVGVLRNAETPKYSYTNIMEDVCFYANTATSGGGAYVLGVLTDCVLSNNVATSTGGGAYVAAQGLVTNVLAVGNVAVNGGGFVAKANGLIVESIACCNAASSGGGGVYAEGVVQNCVISNNQATAYGGGVYMAESGVITNTLTAGNKALNGGGGMYMAGSSRAMACVVSNNCVDARGLEVSALGGGVLMAGKSQVISSRICHNYTQCDSKTKGKWSNYGGGLYSGMATNCLIDGNTVYSGTSNVQGAGAYGTDLYECVVRNNFLFGGCGTGLNGGSAWRCVFSNNASSASSPAVIRQTTGLVDECDIHDGGVTGVKMRNCRIGNCSNAVYLAEGANCAKSGWFENKSVNMLAGASSVTNCLFCGAYYPGTSFINQNNDSTRIEMYNCTIADNTYYRLFAVNVKTNLVLLLENCLIVGNSNGGAERNLFTDGTYGKFVALTNNVIGPGRGGVAAPAGEANTCEITDAKFVGKGADKYALKWSSPARGKGVVRDWMTDALDLRLDAQYPRVRDEKVDAGCYQCWANPEPTMLIVR